MSEKSHDDQRNPGPADECISDALEDLEVCDLRTSQKTLYIHACCLMHSAVAPQQDGAFSDSFAP